MVGVLTDTTASIPEKLAQKLNIEIVPYHVALLARRLYGAHVIPRAREIEQMVNDVEEGKFDTELQELAEMSIEKLKKLYEARIE